MCRWMEPYVRVLQASSPDEATKTNNEQARTRREYLQNEIYPRRVIGSVLFTRKGGWFNGRFPTRP